MKNFMCKLAATAAVLASAVGAHADTTIDLFNTDSNQFVFDTSGVGGASFDPVAGTGAGTWGGSPGGSTGIIGGQRDIYAQVAADPNDIYSLSQSAALSAAVSGGRLSVNNGSLVQGTVAVRWDGLNTANGVDMGLSPLAFNAGDAFNLSVIFSDQGFAFDIYMFTSATQYSKLTLISSSHAVPETTAIPLAAFLDCDNSISGGITTCFNGGVVTAIDGNGVDFSDVGAIMVVLDPLAGSTALDLTLDQITVVPEPASLALVGLALLGGFAATRRRKV